MAYAPINIVIDSWASPLQIDDADMVTNLDEAINSIITDDAQSLVNHFNTEMAKIPAYLTSELVKVEAETSDQSAAAAASAAAALVSENAAAADAVLTAADVVSTNADAAATAADVVSTNADVISTNADVVSTAADVVLTAADVVTSAASTALAEKWAEEVEDTEVTTGKYSALHWAAKAAASTGIADSSTAAYQTSYKQSYIKFTDGILLMNGGQNEYTPTGVSIGNGLYRYTFTIIAPFAPTRVSEATLDIRLHSSPSQVYYSGWVEGFNISGTTITVKMLSTYATMTAKALAWTFTGRWDA